MPHQIQKDKIFDLETAIKMHIEGQRKMIKPMNDPIVNKDKELHIKVFETVPRDSKSLESQIALKEKEKNSAIDGRKISELWIEIQALQRLLSLAKMHEAGEALDELAW